MADLRDELARRSLDLRGLKAALAKALRDFLFQAGIGAPERPGEGEGEGRDRHGRRGSNDDEVRIPRCRRRHALLVAQAAGPTGRGPSVESVFDRSRSR